MHRPILACLLLALPSFAPAAASRVLERPDDRRVSVVAGSVHPLARPEDDLGRADPATPIRGATILFGRSPEQQAALDRLLAEQQDPASRGYRRWLAPAEYASRFGLSEGDLAAVAGWLRSRGLVVEETSPTRTWISFSGTFGQVEAAFHTEMHRYARRGRTHFAASGALSVPAALAGVVAGFRGLDDFRPEPRARWVRPAFTSNISGNHYLAPDDFAAIYGLFPLYAAGLDGAGQSVAVVGQSEFHQSDVDAFRAAAGLPPSAVRMILVPNTGSSQVVASDEVEAALDIEWSGAVARGAQVVYVYVGSNANASVWDALQHAVDHDVAPVVSMSYGNCESYYGQSYAQQIRGLAQQANAQGQTLVASSGDSGPADCEPTGATYATRGLAVDMPASIPEFTAIGGTQFAGDVASPGLYWSPSNGPGGGSATGYIPEAVWNETASAGQIAASGGGASAYFAKPSWQSGAGVPADGHRDLPDVSLSAAAGHDGYLVCSAGSCVNGYRDAQSYLNVVGGTSAGAPAFAGIVAILNEAVASALGNVNPVLYQLAAAAPAAFHPVSSGDNLVPCRTGTPSCPASLELGYAANGSYNLAAGLGSLDVGALAVAWPGYEERAATATSLSASSAAPLFGTAVALVATVSTPSTTAGTPTGTVQFTSDGSPLADPVALVDGQAALVTSALPAGAHSVAAAYTGDAAHLPSRSSPVAENVTDYGISLSESSIDVSTGGAAWTTVVVTAVGPFTGTVALACVPPDAAGLSCSLSPASVSLDGTSPFATAVLQVSAAARATARSAPDGGGGARGRFPAALALAAFAGVAAVCGPGGRSRRVLLVAAVGCSAGAALGCGASGVPSAPSAAYTVTIQGATAGVSRTASVVVNVR